MNISLEDGKLLEEMAYADEANSALDDVSRGCLDGTRSEIMEAMTNWATQRELPDMRPGYLQGLISECRVLWLFGVAGSGKSSIAISLAKDLKRRGHLGSFYGFQAAKQTTLNPTNLFSTIARHLAERDPACKQALLEILREPSIKRNTTSPSQQFDEFLLASSVRQTSEKETVIIIDAFDECGKVKERAEVLKILTQHAHHIPAGIRVIITSRSEDDIARALESWPTAVCVIQMHQIPSDQTKGDIHKFIRDMLGDTEDLGSVQYVVELAKLALAADESFQWASVACLFIMDEDDGDAATSPRVRLQQVLNANRGLDHLYTSILTQHFGSSDSNSLGFKCLQTILGTLVCAREPLSLREIVILGAELETSLDLHEYHRLARKLGSLLTGVRDVNTPVLPLHTSFTDFLLDKKRSGLFAVDRLSFESILASRCLDTMLKPKGLRFNICNLPTSFKRNREIAQIDGLIKENIPPALSYACKFWVYHVGQLEAIENPLADSLMKLLGVQLLEWLEVMSLVGSSPYECLLPLMSSKVMLSCITSIILRLITPRRCCLRSFPP